MTGRSSTNSNQLAVMMSSLYYVPWCFLGAGDWMYPILRVFITLPVSIYMHGTDTLILSYYHRTSLNTHHSSLITPYLPTYIIRGQRVAEAFESGVAWINCSQSTFSQVGRRTIRQTVGNNAATKCNTLMHSQSYIT